MNREVEHTRGMVYSIAGCGTLQKAPHMMESTLLWVFVFNDVSWVYWESLLPEPKGPCMTWNATMKSNTFFRHLPKISPK